MVLRPFLLIGLWLACAYGLASVPALEREISLSLSNERLNTALTKIQEQTGIIFSYPSSLINNTPPVSLQLKQKTVREALALMLPRNIGFSAKNNYIILKEKPAEKNPKKTELNGYVYDKNTEKKIPNVTVYDKNTLQSVTTNEYGYYSITVPKEEQCLTVNKENYRDTCVGYQAGSPLNNISMDPVSAEVRQRDSISWRQRFRDFSESTNALFKRFKGYINTINVKDTLTRNLQVSLVPFAGTNGLLSGNVYNKYSFNIFGGYSRGTRGLELGGFFNIDREHVSGVQAAGFFNVAGDSVNGIQAAGFFNITGKSMRGVQAAGFFNLNIGKVKGIQAAGIANFNRKGVSGVSVAGILNANRFSVKGLQVAGIMNLTADTLQGAALAGFVNLSWYSKQALQLSGMFNSARYGDRNKQVAPWLNNTARGSTQLQVSALLNRAHLLTGLQLGFINYSDSASGIPVGFLSVVKKGLHQFELAGDELFYTNISLRTGVPAFHNVFFAGLQPGSASPLWQIGYGLGTSFRLKNKFRGEASASMHHVSKGNFYFATSELYKFYIGAECTLKNKLALSAGPTFNLYWSDALLPDYAGIYSHLAPYAVFDRNLPDEFNLKGWFGFRVGLRFF